MKQPLNILMVEDSEADADLVLHEIKSGGYDTVHKRVWGSRAMRAELSGGRWDIVISEYTLPKFSGLAALRLTKLHDPDLPFIIASGHIDDGIAVEAMRAGARDYVMKNNLSRLLPAIERELRERAIRRAGRQARREIEENEEQLRGIVANIPGVVFQLVRDGHGGYSVSYVSEGSNRLLELTPQALQNDVAQLFDLMLDGGNAGLQRRIAESAQTMRPLSWEGRIRAASDGLVKWIEIRMHPRLLKDNRIQWDGIIENISQRKLAEIELTQSRQRLSELSSHLQHAKELERTRIAREVHDDIGGNLTAIKIDVLWLLARVDKNRTDLLEKANSLEMLVDRTMEITSRIAHDLRPPLLDLGLAAAIEWEASEFQKRMEIPCLVKCTGEDVTLDPQLATTLFSVFRETLTNISKHAAASKVEVELGIKPAAVKLKVTDNGRGIARSDLLKRESFGLRGMRERVRHLGGDISFDGKPGHGTTITATLPLEPSGQMQLSIYPAETS